MVIVADRQLVLVLVLTRVGVGVEERVLRVESVCLTRTAQATPQKFWTLRYRLTLSAHAERSIHSHTHTKDEEKRCMYLMIMMRTASMCIYKAVIFVDSARLLPSTAMRHSCAGPMRACRPRKSQ